MTDRIFVKNIAVFAHHGLHPEETKLGQRFYIWLEARVDTRPAGLADDFEKTVSYADLTDIALQVATGRTFKLIEALAETIAAEILARLPLVKSIVVRVDKPSAPVPALIDGVTVEIERSRDG
ncbi:dihydroneopterin aldolase [Mongoliimonas terrestris]|uniref:dihydroneopterin aldolase n=1 Tax=Mongoliimonas terrestris TaxID=1709001 RepID=UPI000949640D|nr:dihydroneopterin aldolase [Mongoliimonas terrestris]